VAEALGRAVVALAALAPDLDHAGSTLARIAGPVSQVPARGVARLLKHRGPLHCALAALLADALAAALVGCHAASVGYSRSHRGRSNGERTATPERLYGAVEGRP
jgi:LexA-binding, inner membrane-associated putative hydrolase